MLGGITFWPFVGKNGKWTGGSLTAFAQELLTTLDTIKAVTCHEQTLVVSADGTQLSTDTWDRFYVSSDSYRRDIYDGNTLREIQLYVPDGGDMTMHYIRYDLKCYGVLRHTGSFGSQDPVTRIRRYAELLDKADRFLGEQVVDGRKCVGFEISAGKYGSNPETWLDHVWFDEETRLPVRIEKSGRPVTGDASRTFTTIQDQFDYAPQLPPDARDDRLLLRAHRRALRLRRLRRLLGSLGTILGIRSR